MRRKWYFVAGEQVITRFSISALDAWLSVELWAKNNPIADEFRTCVIRCHDDRGVEVGRKRWEQWHAALVQDTYGDNVDFERVVDLM